MRTTFESERKEINDAAEDLARARASLEAADASAARAHAAPNDPLAEARDKQWVRVALAERRQEQAAEGHAAGNRRRARWRSIRRIFGVESRQPLPMADARGDATRRATVAFVADIAGHDEEEDLHPPRLDPRAADLDQALADEARGTRDLERPPSSGRRELP